MAAQPKSPAGAARRQRRRTRDRSRRRSSGFAATSGSIRTFATYAEIEKYIRTVSAPFGALTDAQWEHFTRTNVTAAAGRALGTRLRSGHRGAVPGERRATRPVGTVGRDPLPDAGVARRAIGPPVGGDRGRNVRTRTTPGRDRICRCRSRADVADRRADRSRGPISRALAAAGPVAEPKTRADADDRQHAARGREAQRGAIAYNRASLMPLTLSLPPVDPNPANPPETRPAEVVSLARRRVAARPSIEAARLIGDALAATNRRRR